MKKHIFFVLDYYLPHHGGVETVFEQIITRLLKKNYKITLLTSRFDQSLPSYEHDHNMEIYRVGKTRLSFMVLALWKGLKILSLASDISVIHTSTYGGAIPASIMGILFRKKVILTVHEVFGKLWIMYKGWVLGWMYLLFEKLVFMFNYNLYHCVSRYTMNSLRTLYRIPDKSIEVVYNGVDTDFWSSQQVSEDEILDWKKKNTWNGRYVVLYYGHAGKSKGLDSLVDCIPQMMKYDPDTLFVFNIIDSKRRSEVMKRLKDLEVFGFARQIQIFQGMDKKDLRTMVASCDVVVAPSFSEGFGSVHTEVVAMDKPLITTYVASLPEVVSGKVVFVRPGSSYDILESLLTIKEDQQIWENLPVKNFSWNTTVDAIEHFY